MKGIFPFENGVINTRVADVSTTILNKYPSATESFSNRTERSKTFVIGNNKRALKQSLEIVHYKDNYNDQGEVWKDIDLTPVDNGDHYIINKSIEIIKIFKDKVAYEIISKRTGHKINVELDTTKPSSDDIEFKFDVLSGRIRLWKKIKHENALKTLKWKVTEENIATGKGSLKFREEPEAFDQEGGKPEIFTTKTPITKNSYYWQEEFTGKVNIIEDDGKTIGEEKTPAYPIEIDVDVDEDVGADDDTCYVITGGTYFLSPTDRFNSGTYSASYIGYGSGARFQTVNIPNSAQIDTADISCYCSTSFSGTDVQTKLYALDEDDASDFSGDDYSSYMARTRTSASVDWDISTVWNVGTQYTSPEIKTIIQEVVNRGGWSANNDLVITWEDDGSGESQDLRRGAHYGHSTYDPPSLHVEYSTGVTGTFAGTLPIVSAAISGTIKHVGTLAANLLMPDMTASGIASTLISGSLAGTLLMPDMTSSGIAKHTGILAGTLPMPDMDASGIASTAITGTLAGTLPMLNMTSSGIAKHTGTIAAVLLIPTMDASGIAKHTGTFAGTLLIPTMDASGIASTAITGTLAGTLPMPDMTSSGIAKHTGIIAGTLLIPTMDASGSALTAVTGTLAGTLPMLNMTSSGIAKHTGTIAGTLLIPTMDASGTVAVEVIGTFAGTLPMLNMTSSGIAKHTGTIAAVLLIPTMDASGIASTAITGTLAGTLLMPDMDAAGISKHAGIFAGTLSILEMVAAGISKHAGSFAGTLPIPEMLAAGISKHHGILSSNLPIVTMDASGIAYTVISGTLSSNLPIVIMDASGIASTLISGSFAGTLPLPVMDAAALATALYALINLKFKSEIKDKELFISNIENLIKFESEINENLLFKSEG